MFTVFSFLSFCPTLCQNGGLQVEYRKDKVESMKQFTPVASDVGTRQAQAASKLASSAAYTQRDEEPNPAPAPIRQPPPS